MALPIDLVLVRHGQSEGNLAKRRSEKGDHSAFTEEFRNRHTASFRLSDLGREQARKAGAFVYWEHVIGDSAFDRYYTSTYLRAMETAALMNLPQATWLTDTYLTERNWGDLDALPENERQERFGEMLKRREAEPFFTAPLNGESFNDLCLRVDRFLFTLHRECSDKRVIVVCHGEVMWAFRVRIERMSQLRFRELHLSRKSEDRIHNCQVMHYTRCNPFSGRIAKHANWMRWARPAENRSWTDWHTIERPTYSNDDLMRIVNETRQLVE